MASTCPCFPSICNSNTLTLFNYKPYAVFQSKYLIAHLNFTFSSLNCNFWNRDIDKNRVAIVSVKKLE
ncbi:hypothetical protein L1987_59700 [Smallanthus sonchifolius]|uniref:Uncharacterized protein n=1 Tax=Smallanthus sonchifolius TaxID=185202 RepID=A0ACB9D680_9ASTR|nr:hypothetical protein L1987_59700 [Smallanthus sonchifolius]